VSAAGVISYDLQAKIRDKVIWLPRLGFEFELPAENNTFTYYGRGPIENYCDLHNWAPMGMYTSDAEQEYVNYVRPQEHGNHTGVKMLQIGKLEFVAADTMEINVSKYSTAALYKAEHTDELVADGKTHLRIDYKVSGVGSNSCGPDLEEEYRLSEKEISFAFTIKPIYK
jgi:beta-galactosidase